MSSATILPIIYDSLAAVAAWLLAFGLRFDFDIPSEQQQYMLELLPWIIGIEIIVFVLSDVYQRVWKFFASPDLKKLGFAVASSMTASLAILFLATRLANVPRVVWPLNGIILLVLGAGGRILFRWLRERSLGIVFTQKANRTLVLGAGQACVSLLREMSRSNQWNIVGLLDDNPSLQGKIIYGVKVIGTLDQLPEIAAQLGLKDVIMALPSATPAQRRRAAEICKSAAVNILTVPSWTDLLSGKVEVNQIRKIEIEDLLGRGPVVLDDSGLQGLIGNQVVMVTGAGGSIGSELCRRIAHFKPAQLVLYEMSEPALYEMEQEFSNSRTPFVPVIGDVRDESRLDWVMKQYKPTLVFHAAAYKHVPLMEKGNASQAVVNNIGGTYKTALAALRNNVKKFVLISSDKAVNPHNVMGATKLASEMVIQALQVQNRAGTRFITVRFGNVLGSTGSVIPKFRAQIAAGGPITVTDPEICRYFMSIPEAAQLVLQACLMGSGGEVFVLDMGTPIKIVELARLMIKLSGLSEDEIPIVFTGLRPGEKMYEELIAEGEITLTTPHPKLRVARCRPVDSQWLESCREWLAQTEVPADEEVREMLAKLLPAYRPPGTTLAALDAKTGEAQQATRS